MCPSRKYFQLFGTLAEIYVVCSARKAMVVQAFQTLHQSTLEAFDIVPVTINFIPGHGTTEPQADL
jgi:hypothetical protein